MAFYRFLIPGFLCMAFFVLVVKLSILQHASSPSVTLSILQHASSPSVTLSLRGAETAAAAGAARSVPDALALVVARPALPAALPPSFVVPRASSTFPTNAASGRGRFVIVGSQEGWGSYVSVQYFTFFRTLRFAYAWEFVDGGSWAELADNLLRDGNAAPAVLLFMESWHIVGWGAVDARLRMGGSTIWFFTNDLHWFNEEVHANKVSVLSGDAVDVIVGAYMHLLPAMFPGAAGKPRLHSPHAVTPIFMLPLNGAPRMRVLLAGASSDVYPYRTRVKEKIAAGDARFEELPHPGYHADLAAMKDAPNVGANFARSLNGYVAVITDGLVFNYSVAKVFEIPACGSLLLANSELVPVLADLGLYAGTHFLSYTFDSMDAVVDFVLDPANRGVVDAIRAEGQALVWARHTVFHRAAALDAAARLFSKKSESPSIN